MNSSDPNDFLPRVLPAWRVAPPADPAFRPTVWERLRRDVPASWSAYVMAHGARWAVLAALVVIGAGWLGHTAAQARLHASRDAMVVAYLVELDPRVQAKLLP